MTAERAQKTPEYTLDEMRGAAKRGARYFATGMSEFSKTFIAVRSADTMMVVATGASAEMLREFVEGGGIGEVTSGVEDVDRVVHTQGGVAERQGAGLQTQNDGGSSPPAPSIPAPAAAVPASTETVVIPPESVVIPLYHEAGEEYRGRGGNVHLHVLADVKLGRRERKTGECLCSKRKGTRQRTPEPNETKMCGECVKVAKEHELRWEMS